VNRVNVQGMKVYVLNPDDRNKGAYWNYCKSLMFRKNAPKIKSKRIAGNEGFTNYVTEMLQGKIKHPLILFEFRGDKLIKQHLITLIKWLL
jgi:hypothetical protein